MSEEEVVFFERKGRAFIPAPYARGPWNPDVMHGRLLAGLMARSIELDYGKPDFLFSRMTVDLFRPPPMAPVEVETELVRDGNRIRVVDATVTSDEVEIARATAVGLRYADQPAGEVWGPPEWSVPSPEQIESAFGPPSGDSPPRRPFIPGMEMRPISGAGFGGPGQKRSWIRETGRLVAGEDLTPFVRVATVVDFTNPISNSGVGGLNFINADITLYLHKLPVGEWIGFEVARHRSDSGIAVGQCNLYDLEGSIGQSLICAVANRRLGPTVSQPQTSRD